MYIITTYYFIPSTYLVLLYYNTLVLYRFYIAKPSNQLKQYILMNSIDIDLIEITITEDYALQCNVSIESLILEKEKQGFREFHRYHHPAVGLVVNMTNKPMSDYSLAP